MAAHRAPSVVIPGEQYISARVATIILFGLGWIVWMWGRAFHGVATVEDLSTFPGGVTIILGIYRSLEGVLSPAPAPRET